MKTGHTMVLDLKVETYSFSFVSFIVSDFILIFFKLIIMPLDLYIVQHTHTHTQRDVVKFFSKSSGFQSYHLNTDDRCIDIPTIL